jgi:hypothetical protein
MVMLWWITAGFTLGFSGVILGAVAANEGTSEGLKAGAATLIVGGLITLFLWGSRLYIGQAP